MSYLKIVIVTLALTLVGCSSKTVEVEESNSQLISKSDKAYIVFSWPKDRLINREVIEIVELNQKQDDFKLVGTLEFGTKMIYEVEEGKHNFYGFVNGGLVGFVFSWIHDDMILVDAQVNKLYIVEIDSDAMENTPHFVEYNARFDLLYSKFTGKECSKDFLTKNNFKHEVIISNEVKEYTNDKLKLGIICENGIINRPDSDYLSIKELLSEKTVTMSKDMKEKFFTKKEEYLKHLNDENRKKVQKDKTPKVISQDEGILISNIK